ncbi:hypothetical protein NL478_26480, partial [Klebsiella pneumoniae]|nr:hypothetical protein [Klebsiella pneumoniae]
RVVVHNDRLMNLTRSLPYAENLHSPDVAEPEKASLVENAHHAGHVCAIQNFGVGDVFVAFDSQDLS